MKHSKQLGFALLEQNNIKHFGGAHLTSNPKLKRPLSLKKTSHLVMRSLRATGRSSFHNYNNQITAIIFRQAQLAGVKVYRFANGGNHLHLIILPRSRQAFNAFIRATSGLIARLVLGAEKGRAKSQQFWEKRPFTRIVEWGLDYKKACAYLMQNTLEALGFVGYTPRKRRSLRQKGSKARKPLLSTA